LRACAEAHEILLQSLEIKRERENADDSEIEKTYRMMLNTP
jgi:hypothetical protein